MNDLYAVDPVAPSSLRDLADMVRLFAPSQGRFIADFPGDWGQQLVAHMNEISDLNYMAAIETWSSLAHGVLLPQKEFYNNRIKWEENAIKLLDKVKLIIGPAGRPETFVRPLDKVLLDPKSFPDASGDHIPRTVGSYVKVINPLIMTSPKIVLVDPYFSLSYLDKRSGCWRNDRRRDLVKAIFLEIAQYKKVCCFEIFTRLDRGVDSLTDIQYEDILSIVNEVGCTQLEVALKPLKSDISFDRHGRYCLGMTRGLHFDWGFDIANDGSTNHVQWMPSSVLTPLLDRFM